MSNLSALIKAARHRLPLPVALDPRDTTSIFELIDLVCDGVLVFFLIDLRKEIWICLLSFAISDLSEVEKISSFVASWSEVVVANIRLSRAA